MTKDQKKIFLIKKIAFYADGTLGEKEGGKEQGERSTSGESIQHH